MWELIRNILTDTVMDTVKTMPILFIAYWLMEFLERRTGEKTNAMIRKSGRFGPLCGAALGVLPQCGFSAAASSLYAGRVITVGTLIAVYLSTSDEMLPIFLSENVPAHTILSILGMKVFLGMTAGFIIDGTVRLTRGRRHQNPDDAPNIEHLCEHEHAHKEEDGVFISALKHTLKITLYIFLVTLVLNAVIAVIGQDRLSGLMIGKPVVSELVAGLVGLIPNCAASVVITQLYLEGIIGAGPMMAGLLVGAGIGLLVLFRTNDDAKKNAQIVGILYGTGVLCGVLIDWIGISF